jgi:hypothetical protein
MSTDQPEWLSLPEAVRALSWLEPDMARRLIGEALSDGRLSDKPTSSIAISGDPHFLGALAAEGHLELANRYAAQASTGSAAWDRWIKGDSVDWATGEVRRPAFKQPYRPELSRSALLECFPDPGRNRNKGGAPYKEDWPAIQVALKAEIQAVGFPDRNGAPGWQYQRDVMTWVAARLEGEVHKNTLQNHVSRMLAEIRKELSSATNT